MKFAAMISFVALGCLTVMPARASSIQFTFTGVNGAQDFGYYVGTYYGKFGVTIVPLFCDDFANEVTFGQVWQANLTTITTGSDLSATRYGTVKNALQLYQEIAYLDSQFALQPTSDYGDIQVTIWDIFNPEISPTPATNYWLKQAEKNFSTMNFDSFRVVTNVGPVLPAGQVQEFLTILTPAQIAATSAPVPEPGTIALMVQTGLVAGGLLFVRYRRKRGSSEYQD
jgi:hypothetical protein